MFEVKREEYVNKTFRIPTTLMEELSSVAQETKVSVNELVVQCCRYALKDIKLPKNDNNK